jgi:hypothetical protein
MGQAIHCCCCCCRCFTARHCCCLAAFIHLLVHLPCLEVHSSPKRNTLREFEQGRTATHTAKSSLHCHASYIQHRQELNDTNEGLDMSDQLLGPEWKPCPWCDWSVKSNMPATTSTSSKPFCYSPRGRESRRTKEFTTNDCKTVREQVGRLDQLIRACSPRTRMYKGEKLQDVSNHTAETSPSQNMNRKAKPSWRRSGIILPMLIK